MTKTPTKIPQDLLSNYDLMFMFDRSLQRIYVWRRKKGLPFHKIPGGSVKTMPVRYSLSEIISWAEKNDIFIHHKPTITASGDVRWPRSRRKEFKEFHQKTKL